MAYELRLPDLGEGLTEGEIARWLVAEGQEVAEDDPLVEIQTDKATVDIPSPAAGVISRILVGEGEVVPVGTLLVVIGDEGEAGAAEADTSRGLTPEADTSRGLTPDTAASVSPALSPTPAPATSGRGRATPLVRRIAQELGADLDSVAGSGPQGRITEEDVRRAAMPGGLTPDTAERGRVEGRREPLRGVRRVVAEHMARAHREIPPVTWVEECDFEAVDISRLVAVVVKACADVLPEFPELNARLEEDAIVYLDRYDIGVAVQTGQGLMVPVVRGCDAKSMEDIDADIARLAEGARAGSLRGEELRGSTFTVTSAGRLGGLLTTPIVNHPEVAILSIGRIGPRPVVRGGEVVVRRTGTIAVTFDHRVVEGARAAEFGLAVIGRLEAAR